MASIKPNKIPKVVFIDDCISPEFVPKELPYESYEARDTGIAACVVTGKYNHASLCYTIFRDNVHTPYHLTSIKVLDNKTGTGNSGALLAALSWCGDNDVDLINMSMGTRQYEDFAPICKAIERLSDVAIVSACSNKNELTFPACLPSVIGVRHCDCMPPDGSFIYLDNPFDNIDILTYANDLTIHVGGNIYTSFYRGSSFAVPLISARVCTYLSHGNGSCDVRQFLKNSSLKDTSFVSYEFYKNLHRKWSSVDVPLVALFSDSFDNASKLKPLFELFALEGYRAVLLSDKHETNIVEFTFHLGLNNEIALRKQIELIYNFAQPDIIFLDMHCAVFAGLGLNLDIVLKNSYTQCPVPESCENCCVIDMGLSAAVLFKLIVEHLTGE